MIFERITLHNFQRYWGTNTIDFPSANGSKSIVLVLAPNNSGKTTILRALRFLLYGHLAGNQRETAWNLANDRCRREAEVGENIDVWVEARLSIGDKEPITLRRQLQTRQSGPDRWITEGPFLQHKKTDRPNEQFADDADGSLQLQIDAAVPQDLFSWFYFAGEPAEGKMSHGNSGALTEPLKKAIQIRRWADAIHTAQGVLANLKSTLQKETRNHGAYSELLRKKDVVSRSKGENQEALLQIKGELHSLQQKYDQLDGECLRTSRKAEESQKLYQRLKDQEQKRDRALSNLDRSRNEICALVSKGSGLPLLEPILGQIEDRLEALRKANLLPADISKGFIERLLRTQTCVCGRTHDDDAKHHLQAYLDKTLANHTNNDLVNLANALEGGQEGRIRSAIRSFSPLLRQASERKIDATREVSESKRAIEELKPQVQSSSIEEFNKLVRAREEASRDLRSKQATEAELDRKIKTQEATLRDLSPQIAKARPKRGSGEAEKLEAAIEIAEDLLSNLREGRQCFQDSVYELLQERMSHHFDSSVTGGNRSKLDRETLLPMIVDYSGNLVRNPGGGEMQVLSIAFVAALAELRSRINADLKGAGLGGRLLGEQSFILDSPFTSADPVVLVAFKSFTGVRIAAFCVSN
ncbi:AAA family ATPase [Haloferula sp.]|uniref:AAA family ATPase n=1 Tax=Haloferula sp. TaxID=2497595 RepID=UPI003C73F8C7